jgi:hypothetical protein
MLLCNRCCHKHSSIKLYLLSTNIKQYFYGHINFLSVSSLQTTMVTPTHAGFIVWQRIKMSEKRRDILDDVLCGYLQLLHETDGLTSN